MFGITGMGIYGHSEDPIAIPEGSTESQLEQLKLLERIDVSLSDRCKQRVYNLQIEGDSQQVKIFMDAAYSLPTLRDLSIDVLWCSRPHIEEDLETWTSQTSQRFPTLGNAIASTSSACKTAVRSLDIILQGGDIAMKLSPVEMPNLERLYFKNLDRHSDQSATEIKEALRCIGAPTLRDLALDIGRGGNAALYFQTIENHSASWPLLEAIRFTPWSTNIALSHKAECKTFIKVCKSRGIRVDLGGRKDLKFSIRYKGI